jgi:prepilin-type N-terminal cleavage/methylation domain-containing protein
MTSVRTYRPSKKRGFSLLELLAVVTILGVIAAVVVPRISTSKTAAQVEVNKQNIAEINGAVERWYFDKGTWPKRNLSDIGADPAYFPDGVPRNPIDDSRYRLNRDTNRVEVN